MDWAASLGPDFTSTHMSLGSILKHACRVWVKAAKLRIMPRPSSRCSDAGNASRCLDATLIRLGRNRVQRCASLQLDSPDDRQQVGITLVGLASAVSPGCLPLPQISPLRGDCPCRQPKVPHAASRPAYSCAVAYRSDVRQTISHFWSVSTGCLTAFISEYNCGQSLHTASSITFAS
jgi:hypothetical protein